MLAAMPTRRALAVASLCALLFLPLLWLRLASNLHHSSSPAIVKRFFYKKRGLASCHAYPRISDASDSSNSPSGLASGQLTPPPILTGNTSSSILVSTAWNWRSGSMKVYGVNLGNWLLLERWMDDSLFIRHAPNAIDQWTFDQTVGSAAQSIMKPYWESTVTEDDIEALRTLGFNTLRIPIGYWAFMPSIKGDVFAAQIGQLEQVDRVLGYAAKRGMYVMLDLHSVPGRAGSGQESGRKATTADIHFFDDNMQDNNDQMVKLALEWIVNNPNRDFVNGLALVSANRDFTFRKIHVIPLVLDEPAVRDNPKWHDVLEQYYIRSIATMQSMAYKVPLIMHDGFEGLSVWQSFFTKQDPAFSIAESHPYPGTFDSNTNNATATLDRICYEAKSYATCPVPVCVTEWTVATPLDKKEAWSQQITAFRNSGGSVFWSYRAPNSPDWSLADLVTQGIATGPARKQSLEAWTSSLPTQCGPLTTPTWQIN